MAMSYYVRRQNKKWLVTRFPIVRKSGWSPTGSMSDFSWHAIFFKRLLGFKKSKEHRVLLTENLHHVSIFFPAHAKRMTDEGKTRGGGKKTFSSCNCHCDFKLTVQIAKTFRFILGLRMIITLQYSQNISWSILRRLSIILPNLKHRL